MSPNIHRRNAAEWAIEMWKDHFIAGLSSLHPDFPLMEWDRITYQGMLTLNLLQNARVNPKLSAWEYIFGRFNFKATPLAPPPPGAKIIVHSKPSQRGSWDPHGTVGFYVGPAMDHYRCFRCYIPSKRVERISDTVTFVPYHIPIPKISRADLIFNALRKIKKLAITPVPKLPFISEEKDTLAAIKEIAKIFKPTIKKLQPDPSTVASQKFFNKNIPNIYGLPAPMNMPTTSSAQAQLMAPSPRVREKINYIEENPLDNLLNMSHTTNHQRPWYPVVNHIYDETGWQETLGSLRASPQGEVWEQALRNEWSRLAHGNDNGVPFTDTISFIEHSQVPSNKSVTYASFVCNHRPLKAEKWRVRIIVGGDRLTYSHDTGSPAASY